MGEESGGGKGMKITQNLSDDKYVDLTVSSYKSGVTLQLSTSEEWRDVLYIDLTRKQARELQGELIRLLAPPKDKLEGEHSIPFPYFPAKNDFP